MLLLFLACAHPAPPATAGSAPPRASAQEVDPAVAACADAGKRGAEVAEADPGRAAAIWAEAYTTCGPGYGFLSIQAYLKILASDWEGAADLAVRELLEPGPRTLALKVLGNAWPHLSEATRARVGGLGTTAEAPIFVPDVGGEYSWIAWLICDGEKEENLRQSLIQGPRGSLDLMDFDCPKGGHHTLYFDYSADPAEAAFLRELQGQGK